MQSLILAALIFTATPQPADMVPDVAVVQCSIAGMTLQAPLVVFAASVFIMIGSMEAAYDIVHGYIDVNCTDLDDVSKDIMATNWVLTIAMS